ncbi:hypothetical protein P280DRAFT_321386 [Massarina eburnea CBS 473.64]|uniref:Uncharacterized protein n=1 Tax=Massarina eburnea CBS 473.64 TaxID=1395130 RepID=A0A6A6RYA3_9PLEO|nr:hypothetical protein P280DRAFT_321386 [Massarina eburnea CBS 473.64]
MTTAVAQTPVPAPHVPGAMDQVGSSRTYAAIAPSTSSPHIVTPNSKASHRVLDNASPTSSSDGSVPHQRAESKRSPLSSRGPAPKIVVKKEPSSPDMTTARHRPRRLDLASSNIVHSSGALTARPAAPLTANDMGFACLSPGFHTNDPSMREQLHKSMDVRERQRQIIEARQKHGGKPLGPDDDMPRQQESPFGRPIKTPNTARRKGPPPGLSIAPPSHTQFASERVIQSAPINQSFTGLRGMPPSRQLANASSNLSQTSHIHHVPAQQTNNRLPPIADVFPEPLGTARNPYGNNSPGNSSHSNHPPPLPSPGFHQQQGPLSSRPREYKSAEDAVNSLSGGREELLPRIVHYGGHQPPTPPSPMPGKQLSSYSHVDVHRSGSSRRRPRDEYERDMGTPPLGRQAPRLGPFGEGRDTPDTQRKKKDEFIGLCARAWDLFHS